METYKERDDKGFGSKHARPNIVPDVLEQRLRVWPFETMIDQVQLLCCGLFQKAHDYQKRRSIDTQSAVEFPYSGLADLLSRMSNELADMFPSGP